MPKTQQDLLTPKVLDPVEIWSLGHSPVNFLQLTKYLEFYPDKNVASYIKNGLMKGFELSYNGPKAHVVSKTLSSAHEYHDELLEKVHKEIQSGRIIRHFKNLELSTIISSLACSKI